MCLMEIKKQKLQSHRIRIVYNHKLFVLYFIKFRTLYSNILWVEALQHNYIYIYVVINQFLKLILFEESCEV